MTDPIADLLARIRNGILSRKSVIDIPASNVKRAIVEILQKEGFVNSVTESKDGPQGVISLTLRWDGQHRSAISGLRRVSTPGQRRYVGADSLPKVRGGLGTAIVSTSKGIMTDRQARKENVGGEVICEVW
jgi:small subunit ribosomal protein S8